MKNKTRHTFTSVFTVAAVACMTYACGSSQSADVSVVDRPEMSAVNVNYQSNRAPLQPLSFIKLPVGSTRPSGWLGKELELQRDGLNGHLGEISSWLDKNNNAWLVEGGDRGWEEVPYWLRGYSNLAYILGDSAMIRESRIWLDAALESRKENGLFGPVNNGGRQEIWAHMLMLWCLQNYYEYSGDSRVPELMKDFYAWELSVADEDFLRDFWENSRGADNIWSIVWYYNLTGDETVLPLIEKIHRCGADFTDPASLPNWHNVNIAQGFREPAEYYMLTGDSTMLKASYNVHNLIRRAFGQVPGGMFGADENARTGYIDPRQGTETCGFVEQMLSDGIMYSLSGDPMWADHCEDVAFNSFPASMMPDMKALRYLTCPNQTISDSEGHRPSVDNGGPMMTMNPFSSRCCQHNHGLGWPTLAQYLILATPDNGLATGVYAANTTKALVADGRAVTVTELTEYPFDEHITFAIGTDSAVRFPFYMRVPAWADKAALKVNGKSVDISGSEGRYVRIDREWTDGDRVELVLPMEFSLRRWPTNRNSASVNYGPLTLSLKIDEEYRRVDTHESAIGDSRWQEDADAAAWPSYEIHPASAWNYALTLRQGNNPLSDFRLVRRPFPSDSIPFTLEGVPFVFTAKGCIVPEWGFDATGLCSVLPDENAPKEEEETITLIPMGAARLRVSAFPVNDR